MVLLLLAMVVVAIVVVVVAIVVVVVAVVGGETRKVFEARRRRLKYRHDAVATRRRLADVCGLNQRKTLNPSTHRTLFSSVQTAPVIIFRFFFFFLLLSKKNCKYHGVVLCKRKERTRMTDTQTTA